MALLPMLVIVDDSFIVREVISSYLSRYALGYGVHQCANGAEALRYLAETAAVGVIVDHTLPDTDGVTLARTITTRWPTLPVIFFTGNLSPQIDAAARAAGCAAALEKPSGLLKLWPVLRSLLPPLYIYEASS